MNYWILTSGVICLFTAAVHIFAGQQEPIKPFLKSNLQDVPKATLLACWHMVSAVLVLTGGLFTYVGCKNIEKLQSLVIFHSITFIIFSLIFMVIGGYFFKHRALISLPQWLLLLPIGITGLIGSI